MTPTRRTRTSAASGAGHLADLHKGKPEYSPQAGRWANRIDPEARGLWRVVLCCAVALAAQNSVAGPQPDGAAWRSGEPRSAVATIEPSSRGACSGIPVTQSVEPNVVAGPSVWCGSATMNAETSLARSFVATEDGVIDCIRFAILENWDPPWNVYVRVLQGSVAGPYANLTLLAETPVDIPMGIAQEFIDADMVDLPISAGVEYVVELRVPSRFPSDGGDGGLLALGCNSLGETAPTYIRAPACGANDFIPLASIGFGNRHLVMTLLTKLRTEGTILCQDGTPMANCPVTITYFNSIGVTGVVNTTTDPLGFFSFYYGGCVWNGAPTAGFTVASSCCPSQTWTINSSSCSGNAGTLVCDACGPPPPPPDQGAVFGVKFRDDDCDGVWDYPSEPGLGGWQIIVTNIDTGQQYSVVTSSGGHFLVAPVPYGTYIITEVPQPGFRAPCKAARSVVNAANEWGDEVYLANCPCPPQDFGVDIFCAGGWQVISTPPSVPGVLPRPVSLVTPHPAWDQTVCWMSAAPNGNIGLPSGTYVYEYCFCLDERFTNPSLNLCVKADDAASVYLNGVFIGNGIAFNAPGCGTVATADPWLFRPGRNCIQIAVYNAGAPTGASVSGVMLATNGRCCYQECPCVLPPRNMTGWWMLDEASGPTAYDSAGFANNGTHSGGPALAAGQVNAARRYDGANDYTEVANHADLNPGTGEFSMDAWIRTGTPNREIVSKHYYLPDAGQSRGYGLRLDASGRLLLYISTGLLFFEFETFVYVGPGLNDSRWHHVAATVKRSDPFGVKLYVDGVPQTFATALGGSLSNSSVFRIGSRTSGPQLGPGDYFDGAIDEVEFFKRALTPAEVYRIWRAGSNGKCRISVVPCGGDANCDGIVDFFDIDFFVAALGYAEGDGWPYPGCPWENADADNDGDVDFFDIDAFVGLLGQTCQ